MASTLETLISGLNNCDIRTVIHDTQNRAVFREALFNGRLEPGGRALAACEDEADVQAAVRLAADTGTPLAVLAGGHDIWGRGFTDNNLILDLRHLSRVHAAPAAREVTIGGGVLTRDLLAGLPVDTVTVTGSCLSVGMTGLALGGGYGALSPRFGLAADCIQRARVVLADGSIALASEEEDADLLWALRGGGSGFGVVTSLTLAVHRLAKVLKAVIVWPLEQAKEVLLHVQDLLDRHPVELSSLASFVSMPTGNKVLMVAPVWTGDALTGEELLRALSSLPGARCLQRSWVPYKDTLPEENEKNWPKGRNYFLRTRNLRRLDAGTIDTLMEGARGMPPPFSVIMLHDFHGTPAEVPSHATAFPLRENHFMVEMLAGWDNSLGPGSRHEMGWADRLDRELSRIACTGGYINLLEPSEVDRVRQFYGSAARRLLETKHRVDPHDLFRSGAGRLSI
jgi:hypothetical protein